MKGVEMSKRRKVETPANGSYQVSRHLERQRLPLLPKERQLTLEEQLYEGASEPTFFGLEGLTQAQDTLIEGLIVLLAATNYEGNVKPTLTANATLPVIRFSPADLFAAMGLPAVQGRWTDAHEAAITALKEIAGKDFYLSRDTAKQGRRVYRAEPLYTMASVGLETTQTDGVVERRVTAYELTFSSVFLMGVLKKPLNYIRKPTDLPRILQAAPRNRQQGIALLYRSLIVSVAAGGGVVRKPTDELLHHTGRGGLLANRKTKQATKSLEADLDFLAEYSLIEWQHSPMGSGYEVRVLSTKTDGAA